MQIIHKTNRVIKSFFIIPILCFFLVIGIIKWQKSTVMIEDFLISLLIFSIFSGLWFLFTNSKIITSPEGIEEKSFGFSFKTKWENVESFFINPSGLIFLIFREPICEIKLQKRYRFGKDMLLSLYLEDPSSSQLINEIVKYSPNISLPESFPGGMKHLRVYQKPFMIMIYYFVCAFLVIPMKIGLITLIDYLHGIRFPDLQFIISSTMTCLILGIFINGMSLIAYSSLMNKIDSFEIAHKTRDYYLYPVVLFFLSSLLCVLIWFIFVECSIELPENDSPLFFLFIILAIYAPKVSEKMERLIFRD